MIGLRSVVAAATLSFLGLLSANADPARWAIPDAPYRAVIQFSSAPNLASAGYAVTLPEFGVTMDKLTDVVMTDANGETQALTPVWRGLGLEALLLAQDVRKGQEYYVYFGGAHWRQGLAWQPTISLLMETRRYPASGKFEEWPAMENAWHNAPESDGAGWEHSIFQGMNPFGEDRHFLSHYSGYLLTDKLTHLTLYTVSSDASFVVVNGVYEFGWPGEHPAHSNTKTAHSKSVACAGALTHVDYYQAKTANGSSEMVLGWQQGEKFETIPADLWVHPGSTRLLRVEQAQGLPAPVPVVKIDSYMGYTNQWLYEVTGSVLGGVPEGWTVQWVFSDGLTINQKEFRRIATDTTLQNVTVKLRRNNVELSGVRRIRFTEGIPYASIQNASQMKRYIDAMTGENLDELPPATLRNYISFLDAVGERAAVAVLAEAWLKRSPDPADPLWLPVQLSRLRSLAQTDPQRALAELHKIPVPIRIKYSAALDLLELDLLVFHLHDPSAIDRAHQISTHEAKSEIGRLALVRAGDFYRLQGRYQEAIAEYQQAQKSVIEESEGRKLPAQDRAFSITITDLLERDEIDEAAKKLTAWEARHPMAKLDSDFLILRGRVLIAQSRWREALAEIESFEKLQPESPYQVEADFYRACAMYDLGQKEPARKIWNEIIKKYPQHTLVEQSREWVAKP